MPMREKNGLVHVVAGTSKKAWAGDGWYGNTVCGLIYQSKRKDTTWKILRRDPGPPVHRMRASSRMPTCVACAAGVRVHFP